MSINQNFPSVRPSLNLNFARSKKLDSRITFTRGSTGTYVDDNGLIRTAGINEPRFDHDPTSLRSLGLLIEESRANLLQYSQALATSPWGTFSGGGFSVSNNATVSPDGTSNASQINANPASGGDSVYQDVSVSGTGTYTLSIFVKGNTSNSITFAAFFISNSIQGFSFGYNPLTGQITGTSGGSNHTVVQYPNGWYRIYFTVTGTNALNNALRFQVYAESSGITYLWGAQLEAGRHATSLIPTSGSTATRSADFASLTGTNFSSWFNPTEGTTLVSYDKYYQQTQFDIPLYPMSFVIGGWPTRIMYGDFGGVFQVMNVVISESYQADLYGSSTRPTNTTLKFIGTYRENDFAAIGTERVLYTDTSGSVPTGLTSATIGNEGNSATLLNGHIEKIAYYPKRLTNIQLQELTK
jgi:hypothetical protein